ncbi:uncharacterized protein STEHIDRAFT_148783 [Stereum hirsutum FP-91666 SS1]|uniref:uncharacterized protein n=1 Tax=Stereum hirsutum (strain FP-91666) TaxID=721885 RepID=UPI000444945D|nr:uncharacterized protein STEHIDRAFT_148783 [Stereum hirsutum FP-91666 SS1]EIM84150.1 hypothetical protein STEHIDRAFT_148783 [Stereum hirsutum FP-91666 SS1]
MIKIPTHRNATITDVDILKNRIEAGIDREFGQRRGAKEAKEWFKQQGDQYTRFQGPTHAEAALMALANHSRASKDNLEASLRSIFSSKPLSIGVSKKCCWACWQLGRKLFKNDDSDLQLPGTHGTVFHWDPPTFGIPVEVLKELVGDLEKETVQRAADEGVIALELQKSGSTQSSPWSIDFDMPSPEPELDHAFSL